MVTGIGVPAVTDGGSVIGRSALDDRLMCFADYMSFGIIRGCKVSTSSSGMRYTVGHGNAKMSIAVASRGEADGATKFPIVAQTVNTTAAPSSGSRIDVVWARQNRPDLGDADNQVVVGVSQGSASANPVAPTLPSGAVTLATYNVPAGISATSGASLIEVGRQAVPYGAAWGLIFEKVDTRADAAIPNWTSNLVSGTISIPHPRNLCFQITACARGLGLDKNELLLRLLVDGVEVREIRFLLDDDHASLIQYQEYETLSAGKHTVTLQAEMAYGGGRYVYALGKWPGQKLAIVDHGVNDG